jgi:hypothetical protein
MPLLLPSKKKKTQQKHQAKNANSKKKNNKNSKPYFFLLGPVGAILMRWSGNRISTILLWVASCCCINQKHNYSPFVEV